MKHRRYQAIELFGALLLLGAIATQMFYLDPLKREIEWRLAAFSTQQSAQVQLKATYDNQIEVLKALKADSAVIKATESRRDAALASYRNSDADISDYMLSKENVENYIEVAVIFLFALGTLLTTAGRLREISAAEVRD